MARIQYELTLQDYVAFNMHVFRTSPGMRRQRAGYRWSMTATTGILTFVVVLLMFRQVPPSLLAGSAAAVVMWLLAPGLAMRQAARNLRRMASNGETGTVGLHALQTEAEGLRELTPDGEVFSAWSGVQRIEETSDLTLIFVGPVRAFVIPKRAPIHKLSPLLAEIRAHCPNV